MLEKKYIYFFIVTFLFFNTSTVFPQTKFATNKCEIKDVRFSASPDKVRIVADLNTTTNYNLLFSEDKKIIYLEIKNCKFNEKLPLQILIKDIAVLKIFLTYLQSDNSVISRLQIQLKYPLPIKDFILQNPFRIALDFNKIFEEDTYNKISADLFYKRVRKGTAKGIILFHLIEISNLQNYSLLPVITGSHIKNTVSEIAKQTEALFAINAGYFDKNQAIPLGLFFKDGEIFSSEIYARTNFMLNQNKEYKIGKPQVNLSAENNNLKINISAVNKERKEDEIILYTPYFGNNTKTNSWGKEFIIENNILKEKNINNSLIPIKGYVLSCYKTKCDELDNLNIGDELKINVELKDENGTPLNYSVSAGPLILKNGAIYITGKEENFKTDITSGKAPRTALGITQDGKIILLVIDGRNDQISIGTTLEETAQILKDAGAYSGINFDGGGSSTLVINNQLVNNPSDGKERPVISTLILFENKP